MNSRTVNQISGLVLAAMVNNLYLKEARAQKPGEQAPVIKVQVEMVSLPVVVASKDGRLVTDLKKEDFEVYEDGTLQEIAGFSPTEMPFSVLLALDTSGSTEQKLARIQDEAIRFVQLLHPDDSVAVMSFSQDVELHEDFSIDRDRNARGIKETRSGGSTVLYEAVWLGLEDVLKPVVIDRKALVLFTDGVDTASRKASMKETLEMAKETQAVVYCLYFNTEGDAFRGIRQGPRPTVGGIPLPGPPVAGTSPPIYGPGPYPGGRTMDYAAGRDYLTKLSEYTGGKIFDALEMQDLGPAFDQIARELASQYSIGYYSTNEKRDGKYRKVSVRMKQPGLVARTRRGYYAPKPGH